MSNKPATATSEQSLDTLRYRPGLGTAPTVEPAPIDAQAEPNAGLHRLREAVQKNSTWVQPLQQEMSRVIVGQKHLVDRLLIALVTNGHVLLEGVPGLAKTLSLKTLAESRQPSLQTAAVHAGHAARRHRGHDDLQSAGRRLPHQARPDFQQSHSGR